MTVQETGPLTTGSGALIADDQNSEQAGLDGPALVQDQLLLEKPAHFRLEFNRERIVPAHDTGTRAVTASTAGVRLRGARAGRPTPPFSHVCRST
ncbi:catalase [Streptomyces lydicus]|uniref:catalase n=1 Tax=Streptomyces lydicus TaxID=47763 RepID=UPI002E30BD99|nr:catalase [Streptomyces lydicus]